MSVPLENRDQTIRDMGGADLPIDRAALQDGLTEQTILYQHSGMERSSFDAFMDHSNQKPLDAIYVASMIVESNGLNPPEPVNIIDVGTGGGEFHGEVVSNLRPIMLRAPVRFVLVEPFAAQITRLRGVTIGIERNVANYQATIAPTSWQEFDINRSPVKQFDRGICSHTLYHFPRAEFPSLFGKMIDVLKPGGRFYMIARTTMDEAYQHIIKRYYERATGQPFNDPTIEDAETVLMKMVTERGLGWRDRTVEPTLRLPFASNPEDAHKIIEFYLRVPWETTAAAPGLRQDVKDEIEGMYGGRDVILHQNDKIIELTKPLA